MTLEDWIWIAALAAFVFGIIYQIATLHNQEG